MCCFVTEANVTKFEDKDLEKLFTEKQREAIVSGNWDKLSEQEFEDLEQIRKTLKKDAMVFTFESKNDKNRALLLKKDENGNYIPDKTIGGQKEADLQGNFIGLLEK